MKKEFKLKVLKMAVYGSEIFSCLESVEKIMNLNVEEFNENFKKVEEFMQEFDMEELEDINDVEEFLKSMGGLYLASIMVRNVIKKGEMN